MNDTDAHKLKYFLYARKSSESEDRQVQSIDDQVKRLKELATAYGISIYEILTEAKSAKKPYNRPVFAAMLQRIEKGEAQGILCWQINRLSRNPIDSGTISWMLQQGILQCIQTIDRKYLPDDNVLLFNVESGMANQYIIDLRKNCRRGMAGRAERGWYPAQAPLGYINDKQNKCIVPDVRYFQLIRRIWDTMLTGKYNPEQIRYLANTEWGFRSPRHKQFGGKELSRGMIYKLLGNVFYTGMFEWAGSLYPGKHTPMITVEEYDHVQLLLGRKGKARLQHHQFAYTGLIRCDACACMITASEKRKHIKSTGEQKLFTYYHCSRKNKHIRCNNAPISLSQLENIVGEELAKYTIIPEFLDWALAILEEQKDKAVADESESKAHIQAELEAAQTELDNLIRMRYRELIDDTNFIRQRDILQRTITKLEIQSSEKPVVKNAVAITELTKSAFRFATYAGAHFVIGSLATKKAIVSSFGSNYVLKDKKLLFEASVWLKPITDAYPGLLAEYSRLEPMKKLDAETYNAELSLLIQRWCAIVDNVRTAIANNSSISIPDIYNPNHYDI